MYGQESYNNQVALVGWTEGDLIYSHQGYDENFYRMELTVERPEGYFDRVPILLPAHTIDEEESYRGKVLMVRGQFHSFQNRRNSNMIIYVMAKEVIQAPPYEDPTFNYIYLEGNLCKFPVCRQTPNGWNITELLLAVDSTSDRADFIPCVCRGEDAITTGHLEVGALLQLWGKIRSRYYGKYDYKSRRESHITYEVAVDKVICLKRGNYLAKQRSRRSYQSPIY